MPRFDVTIAGEVNLDLILYGLPEVLLPERELRATDMTVTLGGSSAIVAHNLVALGSRVGFQSRIGEDALGQLALQLLTQGGVNTALVRKDPGKLTTGLTVILQHQPWRNILTYFGTIAELRWEDLDFDYLTDSRHFHFSSYYLQTALRPRVPELFQKLKAAGLTVSLDTNDDPEDVFQGEIAEVLPLVDVFLPNAREVLKIAGTDDFESAVDEISKLVPLLVVKRGDQGALARYQGRQIESAALKLDSIDAVGAGDSFNAGFLSQYVRGAGIETCMAHGNRAGALSTTRPGGTEAFCDSAHREKFFQDHPILGAAV